jgi:hypothetical protein
MRFQLLITPESTRRGGRLIRAMYEGRGKVDARLVAQYEPDPDSVLMLYGMGGADRMPHAMSHMENGGRLVVWDAGYWNRKLSDAERHYRISIDGMHPPQFIMQGPNPGPERLNASGIGPKPRGKSKGYILLAGSGPKSIAIGAKGWTAEKSKEIKRKFPGKLIAYRPKPKKPIEPGVRYDELSTGPIEKAVSESRLVVCRHSNVAVDACFQGVPVVCDDGAAAAIYPSRLEDFENQPTAAIREEFLHRLAWWQWSPSECAQGLVWPWLIERLNASHR